MHKKRYRLLLSCAAIVVILLIVFPLTVLIYSCDSKVLVEQTVSVDVDSAIRAKKIAMQLRRDFMRSLAPVERARISVSENEINGIIALAMRGIKGLKGRVNVTPFGVRAAFTYATPGNPFGKYINLTGTIIPSAYGLIVDEISVGDMTIPGNIAISMAEMLLNRLSRKEQFGTRLLQSVESIEVNTSQLTVVYHVEAGFRDIVNDARGAIKSIRDDMALLGDPKIVKLYYNKLCNIHHYVAKNRKVSLDYFLSNAFSLADKRSRLGGEPVDENKAALLALAIFLGTSNFDSVIGAIDRKTAHKCQHKGGYVVLANRKDLRLHFIYSAALKIISDSGVSFAIGEFKELLDSQKGGSGFSFADLAADRAGIKFAEFAMNGLGARRIQQAASRYINEDSFFPSIAELPEGIPQHLFEQRGGIESTYYARYLAVINDRINNLALYQHSKR